MLLINLSFFSLFIYCHSLPFIIGWLAGWPSQANYCPVVFGRKGDKKAINGSINWLSEECGYSPLATFLVRPAVLSRAKSKRVGKIILVVVLPKSLG